MEQRKFSTLTAMDEYMAATYTRTIAIVTVSPEGTTITTYDSHAAANLVMRGYLHEKQGFWLYENGKRIPPIDAIAVKGTPLYTLLHYLSESIGARPEPPLSGEMRKHLRQIYAGMLGLVQEATVYDSPAYQNFPFTALREIDFPYLNFLFTNAATWMENIAHGRASYPAPGSSPSPSSISLLTTPQLVTVIDPKSPYNGKQGRVKGIFHDCFYQGSTPENPAVDRFWLEMPDGADASFLSTELDAAAYYAAQSK